MTFFSMTLSLFLIMNSVGHIIAYLDLVESLDRRKRRHIIIREMLLALFIMVIFNYVGGFLLTALEVNTQTILLSGGLILFLIAIRMIFPSKKDTIEVVNKEEPFIFPIATPMIAGPSCLTTIMLYSHQSSRTEVILAILVAWAFSITILLLAQRIKDIVGKRALLAVERLMGLVLTMMAMEMLLKGLKSIAMNGIK